MTDFQRIILVHYHEIGLKGHNRASFETRLLKNLEALLAPFPVVTIHRISGRLCVFLREGTDWDTAVAASEVAGRVPGVARVSSGFKCERDLDEMARAAVLALSEAGEFSTFKVAARRNHTDFATGSMEMNQIIGGALCEACPDKGVRMKNPDVTVGVEVVQNASYVYARSVPGVGGLAGGQLGQGGVPAVERHRLAGGHVEAGAPRRGVHRRALLRAPADLGRERVFGGRHRARAGAHGLHRARVHGAVRRLPARDRAHGAAPSCASSCTAASCSRWPRRWPRASAPGRS